MVTRYGRRMPAAASYPQDGAQALIRAAYDSVAESYNAQIGGELDAKPLDRAVLSALCELAGDGVVADVGCGPGHVSRFLAARARLVIGIDLSTAMTEIGQRAGGGVKYLVGSMLAMPVAAGALAGVVSLYSIIHLAPAQRAAAFAELARSLRVGGWLLVSFHVSSPEFAPGEANHLTTWFERPVDLVGYFIDPETVTGELTAAGLPIAATLVREPIPGAEVATRRCYLLAQRVRGGDL